MTKVAVIGLGYVGLPLALAFAEEFKNTVGFDLNSEKIEKIKKGIDVIGEGIEQELKNTSLTVTSDENNLKNSDFFIVGVPTPIDEYKRPDLGCLKKACKMLGRVISKGAVIVFESTVYPGVTEDICGPIIEEISGLKQGEDFKLGYSPERINPGDKEHTLKKITKVVSGEDEETCSLVAEVYGKVIEAEVYKTSSIKVAEAAKVIENTQRDINIALMNELSLIFERMGISTKEVLDAAGTKWNFLKFTPGLVGGHCIGVDPFYLTTKAELLGYRPQVILAGRRINDRMGRFIARKMVKLLANRGCQIKGAKVGILGVTFKENVADVRNSRVPDIVKELKDYSVDCVLHDPLVDGVEFSREYGEKLSDFSDLKNLDGVIYAVSHDKYKALTYEDFSEMLSKEGVMIDVKSVLTPELIPEGRDYWSL